jgi:catechol 2,3-dioxygenase-like lactoylglutathione lyase family enzyme
MRFKQMIAGVLVILTSAAALGKDHKRPHILGIAGVTILVSDVPVSRAAYKDFLAPGYSCDWCEDAPSPNFQLTSGQIIALQAAPTSPPKNLLEEVFFATDDIKGMKQYLKSQKVAFEELAAGHAPLRLRLSDPDGHHISFVQRMVMSALPQSGAPPLHLIHAGFVVRDQAAMNKFYQDLLGFRPYWHGGMKDTQTDWVSLQVPEGTDWVEYMVNVPLDASKHTLGVMNHIALGVPDIHAAAKQLLTNGMKLTEEPKMGRDGKWQLNLYDPDQTRVELMEFTPVEKPCCSEYTGPHPKP